ncbi:MAG: glycosyltransferase [Bacteroidota bacterium]
MNILQVLSQYEVTGAETFAATLSDVLIAQGHSVTIVSDTFRTPTNAEIIIHPVGKRDVAQRITNVSFLKRIIKEKKIDIVHAHSRAASWICFFATRGGSVPLVSSMHYRQHLHFSSKLFSVYGEKRVAVCRSIYTHLNRELKYPMEKLALVHNGIDLTRWNFRPREYSKEGKKIVSFVGRLTGFKGDSLLIIIKEIFPRVYAKYKNVEFHIVGAMSGNNPIYTAIAETNSAIGSEVIVAKGFSSDVESIYRTSDVIIGSGRVAMEAMACGSIVVSIGESNSVGIISPSTEQKALITNFGDLDKRRPIDVEASAKAILTGLEEPHTVSLAWGRSFIEKNFDIKNVAADMVRIFAETASQRKGITEIPVLSYHAVTHGEGNERTITAAEFESQLKYLHKKKYSTLNFRDFRKIAAFQQPMPARPVILTLTGSAENYETVFPLLQHYGMTGIFLVQTDAMRDSIPTIKKLHAGGMEIGSYSHTGKKLSLLQPDEMRQDIFRSAELLRDAIQSDVITFAYPFGYVNEAIKENVRSAGFQFGVSINDGQRNIWSDFLKIRRIQIFHGSSQFSYWKKTSGWYHRYKHVY